MKSVFSRLIPRALFLTAGLVAPLSAQPPQSVPTAAPIQELMPEQWREDLRFLVAELERRHPDPYRHAGRERFMAAVADLDRRIPELQRNQIIVGMMRLAAMIGDGHTRIDPRKDTRFGFPSLPLKLYLFEDGLYVRAARSEHAGLLGARIEAIGGVPVAEAIRRGARLGAAGKANGPPLYVPLDMAKPDILHALDLSPRRDTATLTLVRGGRRWTVTVPAGQIDPVWPPDTDISLVTPDGWVDARRTAPAPLWLQAPLDSHRLIELPERNALYVQLNMVTDIQGQSLAAFGERIRARSATLNPRALILDLRLNLGGNGNLRNGFVRALIRAEDEDSRLFVLTGRGTFSASQFILDDLDRLTDAIFIGEPASSRPSSFGDAYRTSMPNSGISMRTSILWWQSGQNRDPWTWVDIAAPLRFADYQAGRDPALEAALAFAPRPRFREQLVEAGAGGAEAVRRAIAAYRADPANLYANQMLQIVQGAELISAAGRQEAALAAAAIGAELFPDSVDAALVHAIVAERAGQREVARQEGARVLRLDPDNRFVRPLLERLGRGAS